jgi:acyl-coenzyme A thioesterase PaaI-like protein
VPESWRTRFNRYAFNWFPAYRGTGARVTYIASDWSEVRVRVPLSWRTRNYVGTIFGGSLYGALDPIFMLMLIRLLGPDYVVWDKAASIRFRRPGRRPLFATFRVEPAELESIRAAVAERGKAEPRFTVSLADRSGEVHAICEKLLSIRRRDSPGSRDAPGSTVTSPSSPRP